MYYFFADHLGSLRVITNATGQIQRDADFYPYGGERLVSGTLDDPHKFAGMEYDSESGLHHTLYRQYSPTLGRWLSTDPLGTCGGSCGGGMNGLLSPMLGVNGSGDCNGSCNQVADLAFPLRFGSGEDVCTSNPQALNLYPYVQNNPTNLVDPSGGYSFSSCLACVHACFYVSVDRLRYRIRLCLVFYRWWWAACFYDALWRFANNVGFCSAYFVYCVSEPSTRPAPCPPPPF